MAIRIGVTPPVCPDCTSEIAWHHVRFGHSFVCPSCRTRLAVRPAYLRTIAVAAMAIAFLLAYAIGLQGWWLFIAGYVGLFPIYAIVLLITIRLFPVEFEPTGEVRDILHPIDRQTVDGEILPTDAPGQRPIAIALWEFFKGINQPRRLEGAALQGGIIVMAMFVAWMCALPVLRSLFPEFDAMRSGPKGFPVTVQIRQSTLAVTNGSDAAWTCRAEIGYDNLAATFDVSAGQTIQIAFASFDPKGTVGRSDIRTAAQNRIWMVCDEPSGRSHHAGYLE